MDLQNFPECFDPQLDKINGLMSTLLVLMSSALVLNVKSLDALNCTLQSLSQIPVIFAWKPALKLTVLIRDRNPNSPSLSDFEVNFDEFILSFKRGKLA